ncbi:N-acetyltransferase [Candidatus Magnetominusculus xianensis]|uniref:Acetyltransferase n=1 Tax=Candidatus Magnetominusculus xianensis TaxID=1748249 RepID=A0ABR5SKV5_9BACT|nr:N-acetyltransferase [Candidatus Magnetominusculus xianensis]KWT95124.1 acetyltransferase [Candidatus Magnetominusculus xianensis]MBF0402771.1 N-acetyltransferase [Nitrospirota bacterium]
MKIRKIVISDIGYVHKLINQYASRELMLPRSLNELYENIRDYYVCETDHIVAACALHILWEDLAEIKSLVVSDSAQRQGIGRRLIDCCKDEAKGLGVGQVFALTYVKGFFMKLGFREIDKALLPHKIWGDCIRCSKFPGCDEQAVIVDVNNA